PHDCTQGKFGGGFDDPRITKTKRRTEPPWGGICNNTDGFVATLEFVTNSAWTEPKKIWMRFRVIRNHVAARCDLSHEIGTRTNIFPNKEKGSFSPVFREEVEQLGSDRRIGTIVESNSEPSRRIGTPDGFAKELRSRVDRGVSN